jgi:hypothetical protein
LIIFDKSVYTSKSIPIAIGIAERGTRMDSMGINITNKKHEEISLLYFAVSG